MTWIVRYKQEKKASKISFDSNFTFTSYAWKSCSHFKRKWFQPNSFGEMCYFNRGELQIDAINSNFENFESSLYMKSVSMPLIKAFKNSPYFHKKSGANSLWLGQLYACSKHQYCKVSCYSFSHHKMLLLIHV